MKELKNINIFFIELRLNGGSIWLLDGKIKFSAPKKFQNQETDNFIVANKNIIIRILEENNISSTEKFLNTEILKDSTQTDYPLSFAQERLWFIEQYEEGTNAYHMPAVYELDVNTDKEGIKYALQQIVTRHEVLRSIIEQKSGQDQGSQKVRNEPLLVEEVYLGDEDEYKSFIQEDTNRPFDLKNEYPIRVKFYTKKSADKNQSDKTILLINIHHVASDGWSLGIFQKELLAYYEAYINRYALFNLPALTIQYKDYSLWQKSYLTGETLEKQLNYWKNKLAGYQPLEFPTDYTRPGKIDYQGAYETFTLNKEISRKLRLMAQAHGATLHSVMLSGLSILLNKYTGQDDIVIGSAIANRHHRQTEDLIGFFTNTQVNRTCLNSSQSFESLIQQVHHDQIEGQLHQDLPFEKLVDELKVERDGSRHPIFQMTFGVQNFSNSADQQKKYLKPYHEAGSYQVEKFDLSIYIIDGTEELSVEISYATSLFHKNTIERLIHHYTSLLDQLTKAPDKPYSNISLLNEEEYKRVVYDWNATDKQYAMDKTIVDFFEEQSDKTPDNIAVVFEGNKLSYQQLNEESDKLAAYLIANYNIQSNDLIGVMLDRSERMIIAILGILKTGGAYVCIDSEYPTDRKAYILKDAAVNVLITQTDYMFNIEFYTGNIFAIDLQLDAIDSTPFVKKIIQPDNLAYVIYTSGSTGKPKGVMVEHRAILSLVFNDYVQPSADDVFAFLSSPAFDASTFEIYTPLLNGNKLVIPKELKNTISGSKEFKTFLEQNMISVLWLTKTLFDNLFYADATLFGSLNYLIIGGEALDKSTVNKMITNQFKPKHFLNGYGPTESTTFACTYEMVKLIEGHNVPIGKPINNRRAYILDSTKAPVPVGVIGELYIGGQGVARGYLNHPELTEERFLLNPFATEADKLSGHRRLYKTGDLVKWLPNGNIEYIGRNDEQVKIRGYRIELGEIEQTLLTIKEIKQACILIKERPTESGSNKYLAAYYTMYDSDDGLDQITILDKLSQVLPEYMIPTVFVVMESFPYTINGKLDRKAFPDPDFNKLTETFTAPTTDVEKAICNIWQEILGLEKVGITDDFFRLGGNSILAIQVSHRMSKSLECDVKVSDIFKCRTVVNLSNVLPENLQTEVVGENWEIDI
jgi:amino acid adenylation domain-containing protein